jgi:group I intron endonuclease
VTYSIYKIENIKTNTVYIGVTSDVDKRKSHHFILLNGNKHHNPNLQADYNKYGKTCFVFTVIESGIDEEDEALVIEKDYIAKTVEFNYNAMQITPHKGGRTERMQFRISAKTKEKLDAIAARCNLTMADVIDRLINQDFDSLK